MSMIHLPIGEPAQLDQTTLNTHVVRSTAREALMHAQRAHNMATASNVSQSAQDCLFIAIARLTAAINQLSANV